MRYSRGLAAFVFTFVLSVQPLIAGENASKPSGAALRNLSEAYLAKRPASGLSTGMTYSAAIQVQKEYVGILEKALGERAGYKVGLVTPAGQQRYNIPHPIRGVLFKKMLLPNATEVPAGYGTRPILEPDLLVRVKDEGINDARTPQQAMDHLSEIICFIELADGTFATNAVVDGGVLTVSNVGARAGILGKTRAIENSNAFYDAFGKMRLVLRDGSGRELSRVTADGVMGHPIKAVLWLVQDLEKTGEKLRAGDLISLGSPSPQVTPKAGDKFVLSYEGLPGGMIEAQVSFK
jgi:2-keto-4-pentenoate hydratase